MSRNADRSPFSCQRVSPHPQSRRGFLAHSAGGLGLLGLSTLLGQQGVLAGDDRVSGALLPHHPPRAKAVIQLFMLGGASQLDTFDYKPEVIRRHGETVPFTITGGTVGSPGPLLKSPWNWKQHGQCGRWVTDALPYLSQHVDDMAFLMAMHTPTSEHSAGQTMQVSGSLTPAFPTVGAWVSYALGSGGQNLPEYVALPDPRGLPWTGKVAWTNGFLPAAHQASMFTPNAPTPSPDLFPAARAQFVSRESSQAGLDLLTELNQKHREVDATDSRLEARIASYELAARMQLSIPSLLDLSTETAQTQELYGMHR
ncbi:MAG: DUF1501 domain-containing protein, partial [Planctomycetota bacterium]